MRPLSNTQERILRLLASGFTTKNIAYELDIPYNTAETYRQNLIKKFKAENTAHMVSMAYQNKILK